MIEITPRNSSGAARNIKVIGIGGAGTNALDRMALDGVAPASLIAANTEAQALVGSMAGKKIQLGLESTRGLGSGGDPELGRCAAEEATAEVRSALEGAEVVFLLAGLGGGTGSGAAPFVAELAREAGALVIAIVTLPFSFEGKRRSAQAQEALAALQQHADAVVCFENDRMADAVPAKAGIQAAFTAVDQTISQSVLALAALLNRSGLIHLGFDDLLAVLADVNAHCLFGFGEAEGSNRSYDALARALKNPLMDKGRLLRDCETVLVQVSGGPDLTLDEVQLLMEEFNRFVNDHTRILFGAAVDPNLSGRVTVTILGSVGEAQPIAVRPRAATVPVPVAVPERPVAVAAVPRPVPAASVAPVELAVESVEVEHEIEPEPEVEAQVEEEEFIPIPEWDGQPESPVEQDAESADVDEESMETETAESEVIEEPLAPEEAFTSRMEKPRGLRAATQQASLFGDESAAPTERIAPPVPGRMLRRPFPERPAPVAKPAPAPAPVFEPIVEVESEPEAVVEPEPTVVAEQEFQAEPVSELTPEPPAAPEPASAPLVSEESVSEPEPEPSPEPKVARPSFARRLAGAVSPLRSPELIPAADPGAPVVPAGGKAPQQEILQFEPVTRGRFEKSEPTIVDGQDLDVPTYLRRRVKLR